MNTLAMLAWYLFKTRLTSWKLDSFQSYQFLSKEVSEWPKTLRCALFHDISTLDLEKLFRDQPLNDLRLDYQKNLARNTILSYELRSILERFNAYNIQAIPLKGAICFIVPIYPSIAVRYMTDIDILAHESDIALIDNTMKENGYMPQSPIPKPDNEKYEPYYISYTNPNRLGAFDIHFNLIDHSFRDIIDLELFWENVEKIEYDGLQVLIPSPTDQLWHFFVHAFIKHANLADVPRPEYIYEAAAIINYYKQRIDFSGLLKRAEVCRCDEILYLLFYLLNQVLGLDMPDQISKGFSPKLKKRIMWLNTLSSSPHWLYYASHRFNMILMRSGGFIQTIKQHYNVLLLDSVFGESRELLLRNYNLEKHEGLISLVRVLHFMRMVFLHLILSIYYLSFTLKHSCAFRFWKQHSNDEYQKRL
jgi:hypothetical protein